MKKKYRIKVVAVNGLSTYQPQRKGLIFWTPLVECNYMDCDPIKRNSEDEARRDIERDNYEAERSVRFIRL